LRARSRRAAGSRAHCHQISLSSAASAASGGAPRDCARAVALACREARRSKRRVGAAAAADYARCARAQREGAALPARKCLPRQCLHNASRRRHDGGLRLSCS
jgi:hypothetical protein